MGIGRRLYWNRDSFSRRRDHVGRFTRARARSHRVSRRLDLGAAVAGYMGDVRRVRVFYDGFEYDGAGSAQ